MPSARAPRPAGSGWRRAATALAAVVLSAACGTSPGGDTGSSDSTQKRIATLRQAAALPACPSGLGQALPELTLPCLSGGADVPVSAAGPGRPILVNVWATWCPPCVREVPLLVDVAKDGAGMLDVVGVLTQDTPVNGLEFARQFEMNYTSLLDDDGVVMRRFSPGPPVTLFVAPDGTVRHVKRGEFKDAAELRATLKEHLDVDLAAQS